MAEVTPPPLDELLGAAPSPWRRRLVVAVPALALVVAAVVVGPTVFDSDDPIVAVPTTIESTTTTTADVVSQGPVEQVGTSGDPEEPTTEFRGVAEPETVVTASSDFGSATTVVDESGEWSLSVSFPDAPTGVEFPVVVTVGAEEYRFTFVAGDKVTPTADQRFGLTADADPFEVFTGTAEPGTVITAASPYGSGETTADENGEWRLRLAFVDLPFDEPFSIEVTVGDTSFSFPFVSTHEPRIPVTVEQLNDTSASRTPVAGFTGTAPTGSVISATSDFGSTEVAVDDSERWTLDLGLGGLPLRVEVPITLSVDGEAFGVFGFTWSFEFTTSASQVNSASDAIDPVAEFTGTAPPGTSVTVVSDFGEATTTTGSTGTWSVTVSILDAPAGETFPVSVTVGDEVFDSFSFTWTYEPPPPVVTVSQTIDSSDTAKPVAGFAGTAEAGTGIVATSEFGSAETVASDDGSWSLSVLLVDAPVDEPIPITITVGDEVFEGYTFTWTFQGPKGDANGVSRDG